MAICPSENMHLLLHALKDNNRDSFSIYLTEMLLWLVVPGNPLPQLRLAVVTECAMETAQETLREKAQSLRALMAIDASLALVLDAEAAEHEQVTDALQAVCNDTDVFLVQQ